MSRVAASVGRRRRPARSGDRHPLAASDLQSVRDPRPRALLHRPARARDAGDRLRLGRRALQPVPRPALSRVRARRRPPGRTRAAVVARRRVGGQRGHRLQLGDDVREYEFGQRVAFTHDGTPHLQYSSTTLADRRVGRRRGAQAARTRRSATGGSRGRSAPADPGPAMLPGVGDPVFTTAEAVETLRNERGAFDIEVLDRAARRGERALPRRGRRARASTWRRMPWCAAPPRRSTRRRPGSTAWSTTTCCGRGTSRRSARTCAPTRRGRLARVD